MSKIVTVTINPCIDKTIWVDELIPNKKLKGKRSEEEPGGGGINISRAINYLDKKSTAIYFSGGYNGEFLNELVAIENLNAININTSSNSRMNFLIINETTNEEFRIGMEGGFINENELNSMLQTIENEMPSYLVLSGSIQKKASQIFYKQIANKFSNTSTKIIVDTSGEALQEVIKEKIFLLKPNLNELSNLCGISENASIDEITEATKNLLSKINCTAIVVSLGENGAILVTKNETHYCKPPKVEVKSTVGAGDCMVAGITLALQENKNWKEVLEFGIACGTAATLGSGKSLCTKEDVEIILKLIAN